MAISQAQAHKRDRVWVPLSANPPTTYVLWPSPAKVGKGLHCPSWHLDFSPSTMSLLPTALPCNQTCKVPKSTTLKSFVSLFRGELAVHEQRQP